MTDFVGAAPDRLDDLAAVIEKEADRLRAIAGEVDGLLRDVPWSGPDAAGFRRAVDGDVRPRINRTAEILVGEADTLRRNASEQRVASRADGSGGAVVSPMPGPVSASPSVYDPKTDPQRVLKVEVITAKVTGEYGVGSAGQEKTFRVETLRNGKVRVTEIDAISGGLGFDAGVVGTVSWGQTYGTGGRAAFEAGLTGGSGVTWTLDSKTDADRLIVNQTAGEIRAHVGPVHVGPSGNDALDVVSDVTGAAGAAASGVGGLLGHLPMIGGIGDDLAQAGHGMQLAAGEGNRIAEYQPPRPDRTFDEGGVYSQGGLNQYADKDPSSLIGGKFSTDAKVSAYTTADGKQGYTASRTFTGQIRGDSQFITGDQQLKGSGSVSFDRQGDRLVSTSSWTDEAGKRTETVKTFDLTDPGARAQADRIESVVGIKDVVKDPRVVLDTMTFMADGSSLPGIHSEVRTATVTSGNYGASAMVLKAGGEVSLNVTTIDYVPD